MTTSTPPAVDTAPCMRLIAIALDVFTTKREITMTSAVTETDKLWLQLLIRRILNAEAAPRTPMHFSAPALRRCNAIAGHRTLSAPVAVVAHKHAAVARSPVFVQAASLVSEEDIIERKLPIEVAKSTTDKHIARRAAIFICSDLLRMACCELLRVAVAIDFVAGPQSRVHKNTTAHTRDLFDIFTIAHRRGMHFFLLTPVTGPRGIGRVLSEATASKYRFHKLAQQTVHAAASCLVFCDLCADDISVEADRTTEPTTIAAALASFLDAVFGIISAVYRHVNECVPQLLLRYSAHKASLRDIDQIERYFAFVDGFFRSNPWSIGANAALKVIGSALAHITPCASI